MLYSSYELPHRQKKEVVMAGWVRVVVMHIVMVTSLVMMTVPLPCHSSPLSPPSFHRAHYSGSFSSNRKLKIEPNVCAGPENEPGICMFNFECYQRGGHVVGTCIDGFLFGACCDLPSNLVTVAEEDEEEDKEETKEEHNQEGGEESGSESQVPSITLDENLFALQNVPLEAETGLLGPLDSTTEGSSSNSVSVGEGSVDDDTIDKLPSTIDVGNQLGGVSEESIVPGIVSIGTPGEGAAIGEEFNPGDMETIFKIPSESSDMIVDKDDVDKQSVPTVTVKDMQTTTPEVFADTMTTEATDVLIQIGSSVTQTETEIPSTPDDMSSISPTEPASKLHGEIETGIPEILAHGGVVTFTMIESATKGNEKGDEIDENTEKILVMTLPDGQNGFSTLQITNFDVTDPLLSEEDNTEHSGTTESLSETDEMYFEPKPTSHRPYIRPSTACGVRPLAREGRIVNGERSDFAEWPWQALIKESTWLGIFTKNKCGGVLLNKKYVLTAAHCQPGFLASLIVVLGEWDLSDDYEPKATVQRNVKRVIVHRGYVAKTFDNDLALLEMERAVSFDEHIVPICMPYGHENYIGQSGYVTGWGRLSYGGPVPTQLNEVEVPIIRNNQCQKWFMEAGHIKTIKEEFFCAGYKEGKKDSCEGDSGGPLSIQGEDGRWFLAGTVSHGIKCAYPNLPGVYMKMTYYKPWIESIIN